jgi:hypothetical protein
MEADINYNISSPEIESTFLGFVVSTSSVVKVAIYIQLNGRVSVLMPPYSAVSHAMQINFKSKMSTNIDIFFSKYSIDTYKSIRFCMHTYLGSTSTPVLTHTHLTSLLRTLFLMTARICRKLENSGQTGTSDLE